jgi:hypothetical protein
MTNEIVEPLLSHLQAGPFIIEASFLINRHNLRERFNHEETALLLGPTMGPLTNRQTLYCMANAISRLIDNLPYVPSKEDYWIRETIMGLYRGFGERFLAGFPEPPEGHSLALTSLLEWLIARHAVRPHRLSYRSFVCGDWDFIINEVGMMFLEKEFPEVRRQGSLELPPAEEWESKPGWLEDVADQLMYCLPTVAI